MRAITCGAAFVVGLAMLTATPSVHAQTDSTESPDDTRARTLFFEGAEALEHGDTDRALAAFHASFALRARAIVVLNIAQAYRAAGLPHEAIAAYERYLALAGSTVPRERAIQVRDTIGYLRRVTAEVSIETTPPGASVHIDGRAFGVTPLAAPIALFDGPHRIDLDLEGHVPLHERFTVAAGARMPLRFRLASANEAATLTISSAEQLVNPRVVLDGVSVGTLPVTRRVDPGGHRVEVTADRRERFASEILLTPRQQRTLTLHLANDVPLVRRPWIWIGAGVILAGAAATIAIVATQTGRAPDNVIEVGPAH